jgi:hypothetical protein
MQRSTCRDHRRRRGFVVLASLALVGCGGGFFIDIGGGFDNAPPSVSLAVAPTSAQAGQALRLVAAAADDVGVDSVAFYRFDGNGAVLLGSDDRAPYEWTTSVPSDGRTRLSLFARATDTSGNRADSAVVDVAVTP